eukprot:599975-Pelagomonas_calceolata.AAC.6
MGRGLGKRSPVEQVGVVKIKGSRVLQMWCWCWMFSWWLLCCPSDDVIWARVECCRSRAEKGVEKLREQSVAGVVVVVVLDVFIRIEGSTGAATAALLLSKAECATLPKGSGSVRGSISMASNSWLQTMPVGLESTSSSSSRPWMGWALWLQELR